jgi:hypothetical protein
VRTRITEPSIIGWRNAKKRTNLANWTRETARPLATLGMWWGKNLAGALVLVQTCSRVECSALQECSVLQTVVCTSHMPLSPPKLKSEPIHRLCSGSRYQTLGTTVVAVGLHLSLKKMLSFRAYLFPSLHISHNA